MSTNAPGRTVSKKVDSVRASRDGHSYHEAWAARSALELLPPATSLTAIAIEGVHVEDEPGLSPGTVEIADLVRYHGDPRIAHAKLVEVVQFKYSVSRAEIPTRAADLLPTLRKFAAADAELITKHGSDHVEATVRYDFATNRPIHPNLNKALISLRTDAPGTAARDAQHPLESDVLVQAEQIVSALAVLPDYKSFLDRLSLSGSRSGLRETQQSLRHILANWSEAGDPLSESRLLKLMNLVRTKAGTEGHHNNLIDRVAVLAELQVDHEDVLYPTPDAFPSVPHAIERSITTDILAVAKASPLPLLVHGAGGLGKTVLMQALADRLRATDHVVLFDGFGAGKWRDPADSRHRADKTLVHLANLLAGQGLADILLPIADEASLLRAFRRRLEQAVAAAENAHAGAGIALILDAVDHAGIAAEEAGTRSFAHHLLASLATNPIPGVTVIASCRTSRRSLAVGAAEHREFEIPAFTPEEAEQLILSREPTASSAEIAALLTRSGRNPRCLDAMLAAGRPYEVADSPDPKGEEVLVALLKERIQKARRESINRGATDKQVDELLSGLSVLPPPVPTAELGAALGLENTEIENFAADLAPLLERTPHGLMFRDEPTETLIRELTQTDDSSREAIVRRLVERQDCSNYAARALPPVLTALRKRKLLVELAFDERVPPGTSKVGQRDIRLQRIVAALEACAREQRVDDLIKLLLEASLVAAGHERSDRFLYEHPDLAAASGDPEALRRLFSTKSGWPGGRHSSLAIANAFRDDFGEAQRHAARAIDWHNWSVRQEGRNTFINNRSISTKGDDVGFSYLELIRGATARMVQWLDKRTEKVAFEKFSTLFDLAERHATSSSLGAQHRRKLLKKVHTGKLKSRSLLAAAIRYFSGPPDEEVHLLRRLSQSKGQANQEALPSRPLLYAAARAVAHGMKTEALAILDNGVGPAHLYAFDNHAPLDHGAERATIQAGIRAASRGRPPRLVDLVPIELLELVPRSIRAKGPAAFERELNKRLSASPKARKRPSSKNPSSSDDYETRERRKNAVKERILPLLPYASFVSRLLSEKAGCRSATLNEALDQLEHDVSTASNYPYRDGAAFIARTGSAALFAAAEATDAFDGATAARLAAWLLRAPGLFTPQLTEMVERLSRRSELHEAALALAQSVDRLIQQDTDTSSRIASYGKLARAVWRIGTDEASAYFRRGLDLAEAVGSDDFERANHLLTLGGRYRGQPLNPVASHALGRIFELNYSEDSKYRWIEWAAALRATAGLSSMAMVCRLDDRSIARLSYSLPPLLTSLTANDALPSDITAALVGIAPPAESYSWHLDHFARAVLPLLPRHLDSWFFDLLLIEIDREDGLSPWKTTIAGLLEEAAHRLPEDSPILDRLRALSDGYLPDEDADAAPLGSEPSASEFVRGTDVSSPDSIDQAIDTDAARQGHRWAARTIKGLATHAVTPSRRAKFLDAVVASARASLAEKLLGLEEHLPIWASQSAAIRDNLPQLALRLASHHASDLVGDSWEANRAWRDLTKVFGAARPDLTCRVIASIAPTAADVSGNSWLGLAAELAPSAGNEAFANALERFLVRAGKTIPDDVGDGPWVPALEAPTDPVEATAGLVWARLGNLAASSRWRAAHAVRRLVSAGRIDVVDAIAKRFGSNSAGPFGDQRLPFYHLHAKLWFLMAIARIAKDDAATASRYRELLEGVAFDTSFPHVLMQEFAGAALRSISPTLSNADRRKLDQRLTTLNTSPFASRVKPQGETGIYAERPEDRRDPEDDFSFEYDFNKYQIASLTDRFGLPGWQVKDTVRTWVRRWDPKIRSMYECPRTRGSDYRESSWSSGSAPGVDKYGGYLGWHGLMLAAGEFLATRPLSARSWREEPWDSFLRNIGLSRKDGLWLADLTDLTPIDLDTTLSGLPEESKRLINPEDIELLAPLVGIDGNCIGKMLVVGGFWTFSDHIDVSVGTIIAKPHLAKAAMIAAVTDGPFHRWLPHNHREIDHDYPGAGGGVRALVRDREGGDRNIDHRDPYASNTALRRSRPEKWVIAHYSLAQDDPAGRRWLHQGRPAFIADAWGRAEDERDASPDSGDRILIDSDLLRSVLHENGMVLVGMIKVRRYIPDKKDRIGSGGAFTHRMMVFQVDDRGRMTPLRRIPRAVREVISTLHPHARGDYHRRFHAAREILAAG